MMLKNLWCGKTSLRGYVAVAAVSSLLLLAACGGDSGANALVNNGSESGSFQNSSSSSEMAESLSSVILSGDNREESSSCASVKLNCSALLDGETGWNRNVPKECRLNPEIDYGSMTDSRDGQIYKTVKIGNQVWMAENCAVAGRFYTWAAAIDLVKLAIDVENPQDCGSGKECTLPDTVQGICPDGWHLPTQAEWNTLYAEVGGELTAGNILKSQTGWNNNGNGSLSEGLAGALRGWRLKPRSRG